MIIQGTYFESIITSRTMTVCFNLYLVEPTCLYMFIEPALVRFLVDALYFLNEHLINHIFNVLQFQCVSGE